jgi:hypothetical protein
LEAINETNSDDIKKSVMMVLIGLSKSDRIVEEKELLFILDAGKSFGYDEKIVRNWINTHDFDLVLPSAEQERMSIVYYLLYLSKQDGTLNNAEENYICHYGFKLGFNESMLRDMVGLFKDKHTQQITSDDLIGIIRKYLN